MHQHKANWTSSSRDGQGYTLVELLIVLAVLTLVLGLSLPAFRRMVSRNDVLDSARLLRAELVRARLLAIETGRPQLFQYQVGSGRYQIVPAADAGLGVATTDESPEPASTLDASADSAIESPALHDGVLFVDPNASATESLEFDSEAGGDWSDPIVFYANGRSSNSRFRVANGDYQIAVTLRGLTGAVRLGEMERVDRPGEEPLADVSVGF